MDLLPAYVWSIQQTLGLGWSNLACTAFKSTSIVAIARCQECVNYLGCQFMHSFQGNRVLTMGEIRVCPDSRKGVDKSASRARHKRETMQFICRICIVPICREGVALNTNGNIIIADTNRHRIQILEKQCRFMMRLGARGKDGQLALPQPRIRRSRFGGHSDGAIAYTPAGQAFTENGQFGWTLLCCLRAVAIDT